MSAGPIQPVYSLKNLGEKQGNNGKPYTRVEVKCNVHDELRYIQKEVDSELWCVSGKDQACTNERIETAAIACTTDISNPEANAKQALSPEEAQREAEISALQAELFQNEQRKLELGSRMLELRTKELELLRLKNPN